MTDIDNQFIVTGKSSIRTNSVMWNVEYPTKLSSNTLPVMKSRADLSGKKFGRLTPINCVGKDKFNNAMWLCECECGCTCVVSATHLITGHTKSCGCYKRARSSESHLKYDDKTEQYLAVHLFGSMKDRCYNPKCKSFGNWGGRGIKICDEWLKNPGEFAKWAVQNGYRKGLTIDRIDNDKGYSPDNCRWVTNAEQSVNKRNNRLISVNGVKKTVSQWANELGINKNNLYNKSDSAIVTYLCDRLKFHENSQYI